MILYFIFSFLLLPGLLSAALSSTIIPHLPRFCSSKSKCEIHGTYHPISTTFLHLATCECHPGYIGNCCETSDRLCSTRTCKHGHCVHVSFRTYCSCSPGYTGSHCDTGTCDLVFCRHEDDFCVKVVDCKGDAPSAAGSCNIDHSYSGGQKRSFDHLDDHSYQCLLHGQTDLDDEEEEEDVNVANTKLLLSMLPKCDWSSSLVYQSPSVLKKLTVKDLAEEHVLSKILQEIKDRCPDLLQSMANVCIGYQSVVTIRHAVSIITCYSILMFTRSNKNSAFQRLMTVLASRGNANDEFIRELNNLSITLSCTGKLNLQDKLVDTSKQLMVKALTRNPFLKITGDNLDLYIRTNHQRIDSDNKDIHWFASNMTTSRIDVSSLSHIKPQVNFHDIKAEMFLLNEMEALKIRDVKKVLAGRLLLDSDQYAWLKLPKHIPHRYSESMAKKSTVFSLPVMFKNESKNEDCLDIMKEYEQDLVVMFQEAFGGLDQLNQYGAVLGGDQLTRERLQNVKNIRSIAVTPEGRFEHLNPIVCELWHKKQDLLAKAFKSLYNSDSIGQRGTLANLKVLLRRSDVNGNVKSNYKAHEDLFLLVVKALVLLAGEKALTQCVGQIERNTFLDKLYLILNGLEFGEEDDVMNYFCNLATWGLMILNMNDTAKEGDCERLLLNAKDNIPAFLGHSKYSKYFTEEVNTILQNKVLSPQLGLRLLDGAFINTKGGEGKNKEADLVQENSIRNKKDMIRNLGANKTEKAVERACGAADSCKEISQNLRNQLGLQKLSQNHSKKSTTKDLELTLKVLRQVDPFTFQKGRKLKGFSNIMKDPRKKICDSELKHEVEKKARRLFMNS